jgi:hypothetical protein
MVTRLLLRLASRPIPLQSDEMLGSIKPASFPTARTAADSLALASLWIFGVAAGIGLMFVLSAVGQTQSHELWRIGGDVGLAVACVCAAGFFLQAVRFLGLLHLSWCDPNSD